jgi:hypothetical protein
MHPTVIGASFELLSVAASSSFADAVEKMMVPANIEEICIYRCSENVQIREFAYYTRNLPIVGGAQCVTADGNVVLHSAGVNLSALEGPNSGSVVWPLLAQNAVLIWIY